MSKERNCIVNPKHKYQYCPNCRKFDGGETWRILFCSKNCKSIYETYNKYVAGSISAEEANIAFNELNIPNTEDLSPNIKRVVDEVKKMKKRNKRSVAPVEEIIEEVVEQPVEIVNELVEPIIEEPIIVEEPIIEEI